jgi:hypothetical protein
MFNTYDTYLIDLPHVDEDLSNRFIRSTTVATPKIKDGLIYTPYYSRLFDLNRLINSIRPYIDDIVKSRKIDDLADYSDHTVFDFSTKSFEGSNKVKTGYVGNKDIKSNSLNLFNCNNITYRWIDSFVNEEKIIVKLPTCETKAVIDYLYIMCSLFKSVKILKHKNDLWFLDSFHIICSGPVKTKINNMRKVSTEKLTNKTNISSANIISNIPHDFLVSEFLSIRVESPKFLEQWEDFHMFMYNKIYSYTTNLLKSIEQKNINNPYQDILKMPYM